MSYYFINMQNLILGFAFFYGVLVFFDTIFKSCMFYPYISVMDQLGLSIRPYMTVWTVTRFNSTFKKFGRFYPNFQRKWFTFGFYFNTILIFIAFYVLVTPILHYFSAKFSTNNYVEPVVSVIPGITTPWSHMIYVIPALVISMIFHEFGHALAASRENVPVESCGISLVLIFPVAFVILNLKKLNLCTPFQKLRVYCAGIWHNVILLALSLLLLSCFHLHPKLSRGSGVTIMDIKETSSLAYKGGFSVGDVVVAVNDCEVKDESSWYHCLRQIQLSPQIGFCCSEEFIQNYAIVSNSCTNSSENMYFVHSRNAVDQFLCLPVRKFIENAKYCKNSSQCPSQICVISYLTSSQEKLIRFKRETLQPVLFIGSYEELIYSIEVTSWISFTLFPSAVHISHLEYFLKYLAGISAGLAIMNVIPCYYLDGGYIFENLLEILVKNNWRISHKIALVQKLNIAGCFLLVMNIFIGATNIFDKNG